MKKIITICLVAFAALLGTSCENKTGNQDSTEVGTTVVDTVQVSETDSVEVNVTDSMNVAETDSAKVEQIAE